MICLRSVRTNFIATTLLMLITLPAFAADKLTDEQFTFFESATYAERLKPALAQAVATTARNCKDLSSGGWDIIFYQPLVLDKGKAVSGAWKEQRLITACGAKKLLNFFAAVDKTGAINVVAGVTGTTIANFVLQRDTVKFALMGAVQKVKDCKDLAIVDSRYNRESPVPEIKQPGPLIKKVWEETWTVAACNHLVDVPITFAETDQGTSITPDLKSVAEHSP